MAGKNRTTVKAAIVAQNVPTVTNAILTGMLNTEMADNLKFRLDVAVSQVATSSSVTVNFTDKDRVNLSSGGFSLNITLSGLEDGDEKWLLITKNAGNSINFANADDLTVEPYYITNNQSVLFQVVKKGSGDAVVTPWTVQLYPSTDSIQGLIKTATVAEHNALSVTNKAVVPGRIPISSETQRGVIEIATSAESIAGASGTLAVPPSGLAAAIANRQAWQTGALEAGWTGTLKYFKDLAGNVHVSGLSLNHASITGTAGIAFWTPPTGYAPDVTGLAYRITVNSFAVGVESNVHSIYISSGVMYLQPSPDDYVNSHFLNFYLMYRG